MKKVIIIGCSGSGKSTFARALHSATGLPLYYLDMLNWNSDRTTVPKEVFRARLHEVLERSEWIIDGNYTSTIELRLQHCDTVFFLDYPTELCLAGVAERKGKSRPDMPWTETDTDDEFIDFIKNYNTEIRPAVIALLEKYSDKKIVIFRDRDEANGYLAALGGTPAGKDTP